jgi:hypothetical protein
VYTSDSLSSGCWFQKLVLSRWMAVCGETDVSRPAVIMAIIENDYGNSTDLENRSPGMAFSEFRKRERWDA